MGKIAVHEFITLDGVFDEPRWTMDYPFDPKMGEAISAIMGSCKALLLGRRTFEMFAPAWSGRTAEDDPGAPFMNESPKYVVSATLKSAEWNNSTILRTRRDRGVRERSPASDLPAERIAVSIGQPPSPVEPLVP